ncbi:MAG: FGGY family carbohydrate kinase [Phycisphaerales bacterium]
MYLLGYDSGTSFMKAVLLDAQTGKVVASASYPSREMPITSKNPGWAEQEPQVWWDAIKNATAILLKTAQINVADIKAIGISYQMHGLVCVDKNKNLLRPSIIWCDSRAVPYGQKATDTIGGKKCLEVMLNYVGNFTAAKLAWVKDNEPQIFEKIDKIILPGDYLAMKMTDRIMTTRSGLSEGILWDFKNKRLADDVMNAFGFNSSIIPEIADTFGIFGELTGQAADELGLKKDTVVAYRAGDQPNNAFSLNVLEPGEIAATAGTSGVVYGVSNKLCYDEKSRVNTFLHVNDTATTPRYGSLLCINGTGILNNWLKHNVAVNMDYPQMNELADSVPIGSNGLSILPYGNGAERTLENKVLNASIHGLDFNVHTRGHLLRAAQEGICFAFKYGLDIMSQMGIRTAKIRAAKANMFLSPIFSRALSTISNAQIELYNTDGSEGAARGAGIYKNSSDAFSGLKCIGKIEPDEKRKLEHQQAYNRWIEILKNHE